MKRSGKFYPLPAEVLAAIPKVVRGPFPPSMLVRMPAEYGDEE